MVLVPPGEPKGFCMGRLWEVAVSVRTPVFAFPDLHFPFCPLVPMVVLCLWTLALLCPKLAPGFSLLFGVPPLWEEIHMFPKADMRSGSKSGLPDPIDVKGTDELLEVAFLGVVLVP